MITDLLNRITDDYRIIEWRQTQLSESFETAIAVVFTILCLYFTENTLSLLYRKYFVSILQKILCLYFTENTLSLLYRKYFVSTLQKILCLYFTENTL